MNSMALGLSRLSGGLPCGVLNGVEVVELFRLGGPGTGRDVDTAAASKPYSGKCTLLPRLTRRPTSVRTNRLA